LEVKVNLKFKKNEEIILDFRNKKAELENNILTIIIENYQYIVDLNNQLFIRENEEFYFKMDIKNKKAIYNLKELDKIFDIKVKYSELKNKNNLYNIKYKLETEESINHLLIKILEQK